eukprot:jgi/Tetstr1/439901/TSEL_028308.t1
MLHSFNATVLDEVAPGLEDELTDTAMAINAAAVAACHGAMNVDTANAEILSHTTDLIDAVIAAMGTVSPGAAHEARIAFQGIMHAGLIGATFELGAICPTVLAASKGRIPTVILPPDHGGDGNGDDSWGCPGDAGAEQALLQACPFLIANESLLTAVKHGGAPVATMLMRSADDIAAACRCLGAIQASPCVGAWTSGALTSACACHAELDDSCRDELLRMLPGMFALRSAGVDLGMLVKDPQQAAEDPLIPLLVGSSSDFCSVCQDSVKSKPQCAVIGSAARGVCCAADLITSRCDLKTTQQQRVDELRGAGMSTLADLLLVTMKSFCGTFKARSELRRIMDDMVDCGVKSMCLANVAMEAAGDAMGILGEDIDTGVMGELMGRMIADIDMGMAALPADADTVRKMLFGNLDTMCERTGRACVEAALDACLGATSLSDVVAMTPPGSGHIGIGNNTRNDALFGYPLVGLFTELMSGIMESAVSDGLNDDKAAMPAEALGAVCQPACAARLDACPEVAEVPGMAGLVMAGGARTKMCPSPSDTMHRVAAKGDKYRILRVNATLPLSSAEDFTSALRTQYILDLAVAASVEPYMVGLTRVTAGGAVCVIVETAITIRGDTDDAVDAHLGGVLAALLAAPEEVFDASLGAVHVEAETSGNRTECAACSTADPDSHATAAAPLAIMLSLCTLMAAQLLG